MQNKLIQIVVLILMTHFEAVHHIIYIIKRFLDAFKSTLGNEILAALHVQHVGITSS